LRSEYAQTEKQSVFPGDKPVAVLARSARVFPPYRSRLHIAVIGTLFIAIRLRQAGGRVPSRLPDLSTQSTGTRLDAKGLFKGQLEGSSMTFRPKEAAIDEIVASCNGDVHGALKALLLVNEHLEAELQQLYAAVALGAPLGRGSNALH
jgi:hypothetical protein